MCFSQKITKKIPSISKILKRYFKNVYVWNPDQVVKHRFVNSATFQMGSNIKVADLSISGLRNGGVYKVILLHEAWPQLFVPSECKRSPNLKDEGSVCIFCYPFSVLDVMGDAHTAGWGIRKFPAASFHTDLCLWIPFLFQSSRLYLESPSPKEQWCRIKTFYSPQG